MTIARAPLYVATSSGVVRLNGRVRRYFAGETVVAEDDPLRLHLPHRFRPVTSQPVPGGGALGRRLTRALRRLLGRLEDR